jgi:hypothetical protein
VTSDQLPLFASQEERKQVTVDRWYWAVRLTLEEHAMAMYELGVERGEAFRRVFERSIPEPGIPLQEACRQIYEEELARHLPPELEGAERETPNA